MMKTKLIITVLMSVLALSLLACSSETAEEPSAPQEAHKSMVVNLTCDDFAEQKHITGETTILDYENYGQVALTVFLCSNQTTGFQWPEEAQISDTSVLRQVSHEYIAPGTELVGASGQEVWKFQALKEGTATIYLEYSRPWEGGEKAEWTYNLTVTVK